LLVLDAAIEELKAEVLLVYVDGFIVVPGDPLLFVAGV
jgi:hypothetical protein